MKGFCPLMLLQGDDKQQAENEQQINNLYFVNPCKITDSHAMSFSRGWWKIRCTLRIEKCSQDEQIPLMMESAYARFEVFHGGNNAQLPSEVDTV